MAEDPRNDQALLEALGAGEAAALDQLYVRHGAVVYRMALRAAGHADDAADATQAAFLHVLERAPRLRLTGRLSTYLYPVVTRLARRARERAGRCASDEAALRAAVESLAASPAEPEAREDRPDARAALADRLVGLPDAQREALLLRYADGLSVREAADALGCPEGTVRSRVHHGLRALRGSEGDT